MGQRAQADANGHAPQIAEGAGPEDAEREEPTTSVSAV
jgi:hypothetical protein